MTVVLRVLAVFGITPAGALLWAGIAAGVLVAIGGVWKAGYNHAHRACEAAALRSKIDAMQTDMRAASEAAAAAERARAELEQESEKDKARIADYEQALRKRPDARCALGDDDLRWLRGDKPRRK